VSFLGQFNALTQAANVFTFVPQNKSRSELLVGRVGTNETQFDTGHWPLTDTNRWSETTTTTAATKCLIANILLPGAVFRDEYFPPETTTTVLAKSTEVDYHNHVRRTVSNNALVLFGR
jgi:hypothetical protein